MELAPGTLVGSQLCLVAPLGHGGMGRVWTATHLGLGATVAVKFVAPDRLALDPALRERLRREARVAAQLSSPHATRVYDIGETEDGTPFIVMERLSGETLAARLARTKRMTLDEVTALVSQVAGVLTAAHALGVVHRDIKPENLFLVDHEPGVFVKVLDFGVAKDLRAEDAASLTSTGAMIGTPQYMPPEQLLGSATLDERCDVWSLGVVAYHALLGCRPFDGPTVAALSIAICGGVFTPPSEMDADLPAALDAWFARSLCVPAPLRFGSIREQAAAFRRSVGSADASEKSASGASAASPRRAIEETSVTTADGDEAADGDASPDRAAAPSTLGGTASRVAIGKGPRAVIVRGAIGVVVAAAAIWLFSYRAPNDVQAPSASSPVIPSATAERPVEAPSSIASPTIDADLPSATATPRRPDPSPPGRASGAPATSALSKRPIAPPIPSAAPSSRARPSYCETDEGFAFDAQGHLRPRPECL